MSPLTLGASIGIVGTTIGVASCWNADRRIRIIQRLGPADPPRRPPSAANPLLAQLQDIAPGVEPERLWWYGRLVLVTIVSVAFAGSPIPVASMAAVATALLVVRTGRRARQNRHRGAAEDIEILATHLASGTDPVGAVQAAADGGHPDWEVVLAAIDDGEPLQTGLDRWARVSTDPHRRLVADAWAVAGSTGSGIAPALIRAGSTLRERSELDLEIDALTAQARLSARVLTVVPIAFAALLVIVDRRIAAFLLTTTGGHLSIGFGLLLAWAGSRWMRHLVEMAR